MSNKRPNTIIITFFLLRDIVVALGESVFKGTYSLLTGKHKTLKGSRFVHIWHWIAVDGPRKFWKFPRAIHIGRSLGTLIQVIFYPQKREKK